MMMRRRMGGSGCRLVVEVEVVEEVMALALVGNLHWQRLPMVDP
jgi:hypothetical protein